MVRLTSKVKEHKGLCGGIGGPENALSRETKNLPQDSRRENFLIIAIHCVHEQTKYNSGDLDHDIVEDKEAKSTAAKKPNPMLGVPGQNHRRKSTGSTVGKYMRHNAGGANELVPE
jgi:hypothetical protein